METPTGLGGFGMSSHESERVLVLLKELSVLRELDDEGSKPEAEPNAQRFQERHQEIVEEIKALAQEKQEKKNGAQQSAPE
jgi:hypothetical protein